MAQFIELRVKGRRAFVYVRCNSIVRVEAPDNLKPEDLAHPDQPINIVVRYADQVDTLSVYACSVLEILHGIARDDCFLDPRGSE